MVINAGGIYMSQRFLFTVQMGGKMFMVENAILILLMYICTNIELNDEPELSWSLVKV